MMQTEIGDEIKSKVLEYLKTFEGGLKKAGDFSAEQAPLVVQEFLAWEFWGAVALCVGCCLGMIMVGILHKKGCEISDPGGEARVAIHIGSVFTWTILIIGAGEAIISALKVSVAPRLVILEKISELL